MRLQRHEPEVIDHQKIHAAQLIIELEILLRATVAVKVVQQGVYADVQNPDVITQGGDRQGIGDVGLAGAGLSRDQDVLVFPDETAR